MKVRPIIELGNHERVDERIDGSGPGVGSWHSLIWGVAGVPVLTIGRWSSWRLFSDFRSGWVLSW